MITEDEHKEKELSDPFDPKIDLITEGPVVGEEVKLNITGIPNETFCRWWIPAVGVYVEEQELIHIFRSPGIYEVTLAVSYMDKLEVRKISIIVEESKTPVSWIRISHEHSELIYGDIISMDGSQSSDEDGQIVFYEWKIGNTTRYGELIDHCINETGDEIVQLTVTDNDGLKNTTTKVLEVLTNEQLMIKDLSVDVKMNESSYYLDDDLNITLNLENNGNRSFHINPFVTENLIIDVSKKFYDHQTGYSWLNFSSSEGDLLENRTWSYPDEKTVIDPGKNLTVKFDLKDIQIFMGDQGEGEQWRTIDWFMNTYLDIPWLREYVYFKISFIPESSIFKGIGTERFDVYFEWKPIHKYILDRQIDNKTEEGLLEYAETLDYANISGRDRWIKPYYERIPTFIDESVISDFTGRYHSVEENTEFKTNMLFNYTASVHLIDNFTFDSKTNDTLFIYNNGSSLPYRYHGVYIRDPDWEYKNVDLLNKTDLNKTNCYMVRMEFKYKLLYGSLGANEWYNYQWVVLTEDHKLLYILSEPGYGMS